MPEIKYEVFERQAEIIRQQEEIIKRLIEVLCQCESVGAEELIERQHKGK